MQKFFLFHKKTNLILCFSIITILFTLSTVSAKTAKTHTKPYTIMIYMNGSDLESDFGLATDDLAELIDSGLKSQNASITILTGGTNRWMNNAIPENECIIWEFSDGYINEIKPIGKVSMGNPATLQDFITFSMENYPAEKYGLIMWDHGGGSIAGFGHDEKFNDDSLTLQDMKKAFEDAGLRNQKLEFLGFDACLMATVEMAVLSAGYAKVLIASEDLEPGEGWDYTFLSVLNETPHMDGFELGTVIVDTFIDFFGPDSDEILTLSVVDLTKVNSVMKAMGALMEKAASKIYSGTIPSPCNSTLSDTSPRRNFLNLAERRAVTKTFGEGSPRDNYADMVDVGDMAVMLHDLFPKEAEAVLRALKNCVVYNRHNSDTDIWGLSTFYIFGGKSQGEDSLEIYTALGMDENYTRYLYKFFTNLSCRNSANEPSPIIHTELTLLNPISKNKYRMMGLLQTNEQNDLLWPKLNGHSVVMFPIATTANARKYAIPAKINNRDVDIIVSFSNASPKGVILGSRNIENVFQKGYDPILDWDKVTIYYPEWDVTSNEETWVRGETFTVSSWLCCETLVAQTNLQLTWEAAPIDYVLGQRFTDACGYVSIHTINN